MIRKTLALLLGWAAIQLIGSCCNCDGLDRWDSITLSLVSFQNGRSVSTGRDTVSNEGWGLSLALKAVYDAGLWDRLPRCQTAAACKCELNIADTVTSIRFASQHAWDSTHDAGSDVSDVLEIRGSSQDPADTAFRPVTEAAVSLLNKEQVVCVRPGGRSIKTGPQQLVVVVTLASGKKINGTLGFVVHW